MILLYRIHGVRGIARAIVTTLLGPTCSPGSRAGLKMRVSARTARGGGDWWVGVEEKVCEAGDPALATVQTGSLHLKGHLTHPQSINLDVNSVSSQGFSSLIKWKRVMTV